MGELRGAQEIHLANWDLLSQKKEIGGLGIPNLRDLNLSLLASWIKRYHHDNNKLWEQLIDFKYDTRNPNVLACSDFNISDFRRV